jgi:hypothetical protein
MAAAVRAAVKAHLEQVASKFDEPITILDLNGDGYPLYVDIGGLTLAVEPFPEARRTPIEVNPIRPHEVLGRFMVELVAIHRSLDRLARYRLRALNWITLDAVMRDLDKMPSYLDPWDPDRILHLLSDSPEERPKCGKRVVITPSEDELVRALNIGHTPTAPCLLEPGHPDRCDPAPPAR